MSRRIIDINLQTSRSQQFVQVDIYTGHRITLRRTVHNVQTRQGHTIGTVTIDRMDYQVRRIGKTDEWFFCNEQGERIRQEFARFNAEWDEATKKYLQRQERKHATSSESR